MDSDLQIDLFDPKFFPIPPGMVDALAAGLEEPDEIAARNNLSPEQWEKLKSWKPFLDAVASRRAEFERDGYTFRLKRALQADVLSDKYYQLLLSNDASITQINEGVKLFAKLGDLEPKSQVQTQQGPGFSITINLGATEKEIKPLVLDEAEEVSVIEDKTSAKEAA
jgi:hypothetical protein